MDIHTTRGRSRGRLLAALAVCGTLAFGVAACGDDEDSGATAAGTTTAPAEPVKVKVGVGPFLDNQTLALATEMGYDKEQGLEFEQVILPSNNAIYQAIRTGDIDLGAGTLRGLQTVAKTAPDLQNFIVKDQFKGYFLVGRKGDTPVYSELVKEGKTPEEAKQEVLESFKGKTVNMVKQQNYAPLAAGLEAAGIDPDEVKINDFADDAKAALAFQRGDGDFYTGALPQQSKLLLDDPDKYVNVGGYEILGPAAISYDTWTTSKDWLAENPDVALKVLAAQLKTAQYIQDDLDAAAPQLAKLVTDASKTELPVENVKLLASDFTKFLTAQNLEEDVFNPDSPLFWEKEAELAAEQNAKDLPEGYKPADQNVSEEWFKKYQADSALTSWVEGK
ncbi:ABC transporter substrate-binding protein [Svornostia abyssi]|uniref:ABC transporter substrate-binding protein n=1 Tax=Svornostia abyssi TaxID=2898438 RepID=A0ABY5PAN2_9ACTN|nr:ABC transporter substrate-binding protein [Parviterribacteraceae bacterium J379]